MNAGDASALFTLATATVPGMADGYDSTELSGSEA